MPNQMTSFNITCRFCSKVVGTYQIENSEIPEGAVVDNNFIGIKDSRCPACEKKHGSFGEMEKKYREVAGEDAIGFSEMVEQAEFKLSAFEPLLAVKKEEIDAEILRVQKAAEKKAKAEEVEGV